MKDKNIAGILALFFGWLGVHRFYLGQIGLGILYAMFFWISWFFGLIDAIAFFSMDNDQFDKKYNENIQTQERRGDTDFDRRRYRRRHEERKERREKRDYQRNRERPSRPVESSTTDKQVKKYNPYKQTGIRKFREFDYEGAIKEFEKALEINPQDLAVHFNLACAYSLVENSEKAFYHLDKAVGFGFNDFERIQEHDALAYLRVHPQFEEFVENGYRLIPKLEAPKEDLLDSSADLLQQLKKLGELREKGLLTEEEFEKQKRKLLSRDD